MRKKINKAEETTFSPAELRCVRTTVAYHQHTMAECCLKGFRWDVDPKGHETTLAGRSCYVTGSNDTVAIMIIHDLFGWTFRNTRLLADHYAEEVNATVYIPDL